VYNNVCTLNHIWLPIIIAPGGGATYEWGFSKKCFSTISSIITLNCLWYSFKRITYMWLLCGIGLGGSSKNEKLHFYIHIFNLAHCSGVRRGGVGGHYPELLTCRDFYINSYSSNISIQYPGLTKHISNYMRE
jgi:hypothetical protein